MKRSWPQKKALALAASSVAIVFIFAAVARLQYPSSESIVGIKLPYFNGDNDDGIPDQETPSTVRNATFFQNSATKYFKAILNPKDTSLDRLRCPAPDLKRYQYLRNDIDIAKLAGREKRLFLALNLRQSIHVLPSLMGSIVETIRFLGPENCVLSIVEGNSNDGTFDVLEGLRKHMAILGLEYHLEVSDIDPSQGDRIEGLAALRNLALEPLINNSTQYSSDAAVVFINDVAICFEDILELVHQRVFQKADMTCGMDWNSIEPAPIFYDIWIARAINGDTFWGIPPDGGWRYAPNLFWNHPLSGQRYEERKALQVFACWNGAVVFTAKPIIEKKIRFRTSKPGECFSGEPRLFCKDMWMNGYSRIAVVPSVNLEYSNENTQKAKEVYGYVSDAVKAEQKDDESLKIEWDAKPPEQVKCMSDFADQSWVPWNQGFESEN